MGYLFKVVDIIDCENIELDVKWNYGALSSKLVNITELETNISEEINEYNKHKLEILLKEKFIVLRNPTIIDCKMSASIYLKDINIKEYFPKPKLKTNNWFIKLFKL